MSTGIINRKARPNRMSRRKLSVTNPQPTTPIKIASANAALAVLTIEFDQPVSLNGVPAYTTDVAGATASSAAMVDPMTIAITFSASVAAATEVRVPYEEPAVRNSSGGFVSTSTFPV